MSRTTEKYVLAGLVVVLAAVGLWFFMTRNQGDGLPGVFAADTKFEPLDVREPGLRLDLLEKISKIEYSGSHRNIFIAVAPPPVVVPGQTVVHTRPIVGPMRPPPLPPPTVPAEFFGYASQAHGGRRVAFFTSGDDVLVVGEGDVFLNRFRLDHINNDSADVEEISTGRHVTVPMVQAPDQGSTQGTN